MISKRFFGNLFSYFERLACLRTWKQPGKISYPISSEDASKLLYPSEIVSVFRCLLGATQILSDSSYLRR